MDDVAAVEHTGAAVDDQIIGREVLGKVVSPEEGEGESLPHPLPEQTGNFFAAMSSVVGAWAQASAMRTVEFSVKDAMALAPVGRSECLLCNQQREWRRRSAGSPRVLPSRRKGKPGNRL